MLPARLLVVGLAIFPAVWALLTSRQNTNLISPAADAGWSNFKLMLEDPGVAEAVGHTAFCAALF
ncbi:MAG: sugar ABC transporter permease, partial [Actinomycetota bacterium]|nr:sugar ABC transporter permease [Actinomycetota bacterium]